MISVALVRLQGEFHLGFAEASWLISIYYLASAITQPVMGRVSDLIGHKKVFIIGMILVALSSLTAPLSPTFAWLVVFRLIQSVGSGSIYPAAMSIIRTHFHENQAKTLSIISMFMSGAAAFGPTIGGFLIHWSDWPAIFLINFPMIILGFILALYFIPKDQPKRSTQSKLYKLLDLPGILLFSLAIVFGLFFLISLEEKVYWTAGILTIGSTVAFLKWEKKADQPFIDLNIFYENRTLTWIHIQFIIINIIFYSMMFGVPVYLQSLQELDSLAAGVLMLCFSGMSVIVSPIAGAWIERSGPRPALIFSSLFLTIGSLFLSTWGSETAIHLLAIGLCLFGISNGFNNVGLQVALFENTPAQIIGTASGLFMTARYFGTILSTLLLALSFGEKPGEQSVFNLAITLFILSLSIIWMSLSLSKERQNKTMA